MPFNLHLKILFPVIKVVFEGVTQIHWVETSICDDDDKIYESTAFILRHSAKHEIPGIFTVKSRTN